MLPVKEVNQQRYKIMAYSEPGRNMLYKRR